MTETVVEPIPMLLWCPECRARHIDTGIFVTKPHHTHACQTCGHVWRPAIVPTVGVQFLPGFKNEPVADADSIKQKDLLMKLRTHIDELELSVRTDNGLRNAGLFYVGDIVRKNVSYFLGLKYFGKKSASDLESALSRLGLTLDMRLDDWAIDAMASKIKETA